MFIKKIKLNTFKVFVSSLAAITLCNNAFAFDVNKEVKKMLSQPKQLEAGKKIFEGVCSACHNKDLSGATGFNLKDGEWIHGNKPKEILNNIKTGFSNAGMPGFKGMFNDEQLKQVVAYVMSKREGWDNLSYEIYQLDSQDKLNFDVLKGKKPIKTGKLSKNMADYEIPEIKDYAIIFKGDFYAPNVPVVNLSSNNPGYVLVDVSVNGKKPVRLKGHSPLAKGKQKLVVRMMTLDRLVFAKHNKSPRTNVSLMVTGKDTRKLFPVSTRAMSLMTANKLNVLATKQPLVQRKKILDLPTFSIVAGLPEKINYAFNAKDCSIAGAWTGDLLNIGPNVKNRGNEHSLILGKWIFHAPDGITPISTTKACRFNEYTRLGNPQFFFTIDDVKYSVEAKVINSQAFNLNYTVIDNPKKVKTITFSLPNNTGKKVTSKDGSLLKNKLKINIENKKQFSFYINAQG